MDQAGECRALAELTDQPAAGEAIHVYERVPAAGGERGPGAEKRGAFDVTEIPDGAVVSYRLTKTDPPVRDEWVRTTEPWRSWCEAQRQLERSRQLAPPGAKTELEPTAQAVGNPRLFETGGHRVV